MSRCPDTFSGKHWWGARKCSACGRLRYQDTAEDLLDLLQTNNPDLQSEMLNGIETQFQSQDAYDQTLSLLLQAPLSATLLEVDPNKHPRVHAFFEEARNYQPLLKKMADYWSATPQRIVQWKGMVRDGVVLSLLRIVHS